MEIDNWLRGTPSVVMKVVRKCLEEKELSAFLSCMAVRN